MIGGVNSPTEHGSGGQRRKVIEVRERVGAWEVILRWPFFSRAGGPQEVIFRPAEDADPAEVARGISTTTLRRLDLAGLTEQRWENARGLGMNRAMQDLMSGIVGRPSEDFDLAEILRDGVTPLYLALVSERYVNLVHEGVRAPVPALALAVGRSPDTIRGHLKQARRDGLLTVVPGKPGGELTTRAIKILQQASHERER